MTTTEVRIGVLHDYGPGNYIEGTPLEGQIDWNALEETTAELIAILEDVVDRFDHMPVVAVSGGIDGIVTAHICKRAGIDRAMNVRCPEEFPSNQEYVDGILPAWGFDVSYVDRSRLNMNYLLEDPDVRLMPGPEERAWQLKARQTKAMIRWPRPRDHVEVFIQGRRKTHNTSLGYSFVNERVSHLEIDPICDWKWPYVIGYADKHDIPISPVYRVLTQSVGEPWFKPPRHTDDTEELVQTTEEAWWEIRHYCLRYGYTDFWRYIINFFPHGEDEAGDWAMQEDLAFMDIEDGYEYGCDVDPNPHPTPGHPDIDPYRDETGVGEQIYASLDEERWDIAQTGG